MVEKSKEFFEFRKQLKFLQKQKGEGTELISLYIPPGANVNDVSMRLREEHGQAMNIKSKQTRKNVQAAIDKIVQTLKGVHKASGNGAAIFCGSLGGKIELFNIVPPEPVNIQLYRCDSHFVLEPLLEMIETKEIFGIVVIDRREATIALLKGKNVRVIYHTESAVPGKHRKGGQSSQRFERLIEQAAHEFFKRVGDVVNKSFKEEKIKGIIVGGPGPTKETFLKGEYIQPNVKKKVVGSVDTGYTDEVGVKEVVDKSAEIMTKLEVVKEKELVKNFLEKVGKRGLAAFGGEEVKKALENGQVDTLLLSEELEPKELEKLASLAENTGAKIEMVSRETPEGDQFYKAFKGVGAFLRYK